MPDPAINALKGATKGLLYMSETDAPFQTFAWKHGEGALTDKKVLELSKHELGTKIEKVKLDEFLGDYAEGGDEDAEKYKNLLRVINEHLSDVRVFKVGQVNLDIYIVGRTRQGDWVGLQTKAVET